MQSFGDLTTVPNPTPTHRPRQGRSLRSLAGGNPVGWVSAQNLPGVVWGRVSYWSGIARMVLPGGGPPIVEGEGPSLAGRWSAEGVCECINIAVVVVWG